jgi:RNA polymerase sigma factor (sigma-70 family)
MKLDRTEQERLCREHMEPARRFLRNAVGPAAEEYAGVGLLKAVQKFDTDHGVPFDKFLNYTLRKVALQELRQFNGRPGSRRHAAQRSQWGLEDFDQDEQHAHASEPDRQNEEREEFVRVLAASDRLADDERAIVLGRLLCELPREGIRQITGRSMKGNHGRAIAQLQRS